MCVVCVCGIVLILMIPSNGRHTYYLWFVALQGCIPESLSHPCYISHIPGILHVGLPRKRSRSSASAGETPVKKKTMDDMEGQVESSAQGKCRRRI